MREGGREGGGTEVGREGERKDIQIVKENRKPSLLADDMIL